MQNLNLNFKKYQGTGNDFVIIPDIDGEVFKNVNKQMIACLCDRKFGIGADGLILVEKSKTGKYKMVYYNSDGAESTFCGNGGRCFAAFIFDYLEQDKDYLEFDAMDGSHMAKKTPQGDISLSMNEPSWMELPEGQFIIDTGSPHVIIWIEEALDSLDVDSLGREIRYSSAYEPEGVNVNFVSEEGGVYRMRTYERGVEAETLSCGTGACAVAVWLAHRFDWQGDHRVSLFTPGGVLRVKLLRTGQKISSMVLEGPAALVFEGTVSVRIQ